MVDVETGKVLIDPETLKPREYVDPYDYTQQFDLGPDRSDARKRRQLVIKADVHAGFPTVHSLRVLIVVAEKGALARIREPEGPDRSRGDWACPEFVDTGDVMETGSMEKRKRRSMSFELIEAEKGHYPNALMCRALGLSRSGHHAFSTRGPSQRALDRRKLDVLVAAIFAELEGRYGAPRIEQELRRRGHRTSRKRVAASMVRQGSCGASLDLACCSTPTGASSSPPSPSGTFSTRVGAVQSMSRTGNC